MDVLALLKQDHKMVGDLIDQVEKCEPGDKRLTELAMQISQALTVHAAIEEKYFYPELRDRSEDDDERVDVYEAFTEHDVVKHLIALVKSGRKRPEEFKAELQVLGENVKHHVREEESTIFNIAREVMDADELNELGDEMAAAKQRLMRSSASRKTNGRKTGGRKSTTRKAARNGSTRKTAKKSRTRKSR